MAYTFIMMTKDRTDKTAVQFDVPKIAFWLVLIVALVAPFAAYVSSYYYFAPKFLMPEVGRLGGALSTAEKQLSELHFQAETLKTRNTSLEETLETERQQRAEAEARVSMSESARTSSTDRMQELEDEVYELRQALGFYEAFIKPASDTDELQCFNIHVAYDSAKKSLNYAVNFLRTNQKQKDQIRATVKFRVLSGSNVVNLDRAVDQTGKEADGEAELSMVKDRRLQGEMRVNVPEDGLRILDIKAYDKGGEVVSHCWKAF